VRAAWSLLYLTIAAVLAPLLSMVIVLFAVLVDCLLEKTAGRGLVAMRGEQEVDCVTVAIDGTIEVAPAAADLDVRGRTGD
jgi:hypothetical protein